MMQIPLLSSLLGLGTLPLQTQPVGEPGGEGFAQLLAAVPVQSGQEAPDLPPIQPATVALVPAKPAQQAALPAELGAALAPPASAQAPQEHHPHKSAAPGKTPPETGKLVPLLPLAAESVATGVKSMLATDEPTEAADKTKAAPASLPFADLALLQNWAPQPGLAAEPPAKPQTPYSLPDPQLIAAAPLDLQTAMRTTKGRSPPAAEAPAPVSDPETTGDPPIVVSIPLVRSQSARQPIAPHAPEPAPLPQPALQLAEPPPTPPEPAANGTASEQPTPPEAELDAVIDRLVETRIQSREGRSEVNLPHPDFGRVTLALSFAGQDRLSLTMPDAPAELRAAVGQAFAPPARTDSAPAVPPPESGFASASDARGQTANRDHQSSGGRGDPSRANTYAAQNRQFTTNADNRRQASGRGVLA